MDEPIGNSVESHRNQFGNSIETSNSHFGDSIEASNSRFGNCIESSSRQLGEEPDTSHAQQNVGQDVNPERDCSDQLDDGENTCCKFVLESSRLRSTICQKNPRHIAYIPVGDFSHTDLPEPYRDSMFDDLVKYFSDLVVKINVNYISPERPAHFAVKPNKPRKLKSATTPIITGSGKVIFAEFPKDGYVYYQGEDTLIRIVTACHVVFNEEEAKCTTVDLFYDKEDAKCATLTGYHVEYSNVDDVVTVFVCSTEDRSLIKCLRDTIYKYVCPILTGVQNKFPWAATPSGRLWKAVRAKRPSTQSTTMMYRPVQAAVVPHSV